MKKREARRVLEKFEMAPRPGRELFACLFHNGRMILTTAVPKGEGTGTSQINSGNSSSCRRISSRLRSAVHSDGLNTSSIFVRAVSSTTPLLPLRRRRMRPEKRSRVVAASASDPSIPGSMG